MYFDQSSTDLNAPVRILSRSNRIFKSVYLCLDYLWEVRWEKQETRERVKEGCAACCSPPRGTGGVQFRELFSPAGSFVLSIERERR